MKIIRTIDPSGVVQIAERHPDGSATLIRGDVFGSPALTDIRIQVGPLLPPVEPAAILCIGLNYRKHAAETGARIPSHPVLFMKNPSSAIGAGVPVQIPTRLRSEKVDFEGELAIVIGKTCKNVDRDHALDYVLGYTCANDVTARDWQKEFGGSQWSKGKGFDTFCPLGPCLVTVDELKDPNRLHLQTRVNGEVMQDESTSDMIFDVATVVEFLSGGTTLRPGTVILTGTPSGVGMARTPPRFLSPGDLVEVEIDGIGLLANPVELEP